MMNKWLTRSLVTLGLLASAALPAAAGYPEFEDVQKTNADPSPVGYQSHINDYRFQDEQINVKPGDGVVKVLRTDQKNLVNDFVTATVPLKNASAPEILKVMRVVTATEGGRAEVIRDKKTGENFVQLMAPKYMMPFLVDAVKELDVEYLKEYWDGSVDIYLKIQHRKAADVDAIAAYYAGDSGFSTVDTTNNSLRRFDEAYRCDEYTKAVQMVDIPCNQVELEVTVYEVNTSNDLKLGLDYIAWQNGPGRNLWSFAEAGYSANQRARSKTSVYDPFLDARADVLAYDKESVLDSAARESYRAVNYLLTSNFVDFLQVKGQARVMTSQNLLLCSSKTGTISTEDQVLALVSNSNEISQEELESGPIQVIRYNDGLLFTAVKHNEAMPTEAATARSSDGYYYYSGTDAHSIDASTVRSPYAVGVKDSNRRLHYQNAGSVGMSLELTPYVGTESMELVMDMQIGEEAGIAPNGTPLINTRTVNTTVRLMDGQPFVLAGLRSKRDDKSTAKAPWLGSIPVVGYLFGGEQDIKRYNDVVITITPRFILSSQTNIATPPRVNTLDLLVNTDPKCKDIKQGAPKLKFGYDQWLLEKL